MNRVRNKLVLLFVAATLLPLGAALWVSSFLIDQSLGLASTQQLDELSQSLEATGKALYQSTRDALRRGVATGEITAKTYPVSNRSAWPDEVSDFYMTDEPERLAIAGEQGESLHYLVRRNGVLLYAKPFGGPGMEQLSREHARARATVGRSAAHDLRRGFLYTLLSLSGFIWVLAMIVLFYWANRISKPINQLTGGLAQLADGNFGVRLAAEGRDEVALAMAAFNHSAEQLQQSRERLIHLTRLASWQTIARKMAHEVKNSLTPIRLTMEEVSARGADTDPEFLEQAAQIVIDEVATLERRVRAFSEFAAEPPVHIGQVDVNALIEERVAFLRGAHPEVAYELRLESGRLAAADEDLIRGVLTNLLENAAEAAGAGGVVRGKTFTEEGHVAIEVHDSGPGLSPLVQGTLFEPSISFKKSGMGLGLSIARKSTLLSGGDIAVVQGELGGAGFRVLLPACT